MHKSKFYSILLLLLLLLVFNANQPLQCFGGFLIEAPTLVFEFFCFCFRLQNSGCRYQQKYKSFKRYRHKRDGKLNCPLKNSIDNKKLGCPVIITNCSTFFTGIEKCKTKRSSKKTNRLAIEVEHEIAKQLSQSVNSSPF